MASTKVHASSFTPQRQARRVWVASSALVLLLVTQYVLGIAYNLYGTAPTAANNLKPFSSPLLAAHVVVGTLLIALAIYLVVAAIRTRVRPAVAASAVGLATLIGAWVTGSAFTQKGTSGFSMAMGVLTAVALLCYGALVRVSDAHSRD